jgi:DNA topoisomerase-3
MGFIRRDKKNILTTTAGAELVSIMPDILKSAKLTADWENGLALVAEGKLEPEIFMREIEDLTKQIISSAKENVNPEKIAKREFKGEKIGSCPRCKSDVCETPKSATLYRL